MTTAAPCPPAPSSSPSIGQHPLLRCPNIRTIQPTFSYGGPEPSSGESLVLGLEGLDLTLASTFTGSGSREAILCSQVQFLR